MDVKATGKKSLVAPHLVQKPVIETTRGTPIFLDKLREADEDRRREACNELLEKIDKAGDELKTNPSPVGLHRYRELVSSFMKEALSQSYEINQEPHWDQYGNKKTMVTVKKINESLEELMDMVINGANNQVNLVAKLDQIRGLLLDIYL